MQIRLLLVGILLIAAIQTIQATLHPVTGDTSTIWNAIDLLPADQNTIDLNNDMPNAAQPSNDSSAAKPAATPSAVTAPEPAPPLPPAETPEIHSAEQPASAPPETSPSETAAKEAIVPSSDRSSPPSTNATVPASAATKPVDPHKNRHPTASTDVANPSNAAAKKHDAADTTAASPDSAASGTLIITSSPDSVPIIINDVGVGITPYHATGFYPGLYEIVLKKEGFESFKKSVELKANGTEFINGTLEEESGYLYVASMPESALVVLNDEPAGKTPFLTTPLKPGIYHLRVELTGYTPYSEQLGITSNLTDTIQVSLLPLKKPGLSERFHLKKSRSIRRIAFGAVGVIAGGSGLFLNMRTENKLHAENRAYEAYSEYPRSTPEYTRLYHSYVNAKETTDRYMKARNICYAIGIAASVGFVFSIPF